MRMFRIKMTAARTNPQQIREVRIDSEKTVGELLELVRIVYEYGDVRGSLLNEAGASQSPETKLKDRIHVRDLLTVNYANKSITRSTSTKEYPRRFARSTPMVLFPDAGIPIIRIFFFFITYASLFCLSL